MKKPIIAVIGVIACVTLCAAVWPWSTEVEKLPAEPAIHAINAETEVQLEKAQDIFISEVMSAPEAESVTESETQMKEVTTEEKTDTVPPTASKPQTASKHALISVEPKPVDRTVIDGEPHVWIPGFGWIKDEGGGSVGTMVGNPGDQLTGHKVGIMGGGTTVDGKGDIHKQVGIMGSSPVAEDMYENGNKIGIMGGDTSAPNCTSPPKYAEPEITGDVIYTELQPPVTKGSTPPAYKPNGEPYNP